MADRLQRTGLNESTYERPNQDWVCGWAAEGRPCRVGPNKRGDCVATFECTPSKSGDRWQCARLPVYGGKCIEGPRPDGSCCKPIIPCQPVKSWRAKRARLAVMVTALTLGILIVALTSFGPLAVSPGPLNAKHSTAAHGCVACHTAGHDGFADMFARAVAGEDKVAESFKCTTCHDRGEDPLAAHSLSPQRLHEWTTAAMSSANEAKVSASLKLSNALADSERLKSKPLACATCHTEHRGRHENLKQLTSNQCQACHTKQFSRFDIDHPQFNRFPYERRTRLIFDHVAHLNKHFAKKEQKVFDCNGCHVPHDNNRNMLTRDFDQTCAACHANQIVADSVPVLVIPVLDLDSLEERDVDIGTWPEEGVEGISPFFRLLLDARPQTREALALVDEIDDLEDLSDEDAITDEHLDALKTVVWGIKRILSDLDKGGHAALHAYLAALLGDELTDEGVTKLSAGLPHGEISEMVNHWFKDLDEELENHQAGLSVPTQKFEASVAKLKVDDECADDGFVRVAMVDPCTRSLLETASERDRHFSTDWDRLLGSRDAEPEIEPLPDEIDEADPEDDWASGGGWFFSEDEYGLRYSVSGHADSFLQGWLEVASRLRPQDKVAFDRLSNDESPGRCTKCHSIDVAGDRSKHVNWGPFSAPSEQTVTAFSHQAHFSLGDQKGCQSCHEFNDSGDYLESYSDNDPYVYTSGFKPMEIATCRECHNERHVGSECLTCHRYHVGDFKPTLLTVQSLQ